MVVTPTQAAELTAGDFDDNLNFADYLDYESSPFSGANASGMPNLTLSDRVTLRLFDGQGNPASNARAHFTAQAQSGEEVDLIAGDDGVVRFFPTFDGAANVSEFTMDVYMPGETQVASSTVLRLADLDARRDLTLELRNATASLPEALDFMFLIDTTGSMGDEIAYLRTEFANITAAVAADHPNTSTRYGLVVYRDTGDEYVTRDFGFTDNASEMQGWLHGLAADGGGDMPEAMDQGLGVAVGEGWRAGNVARVMFLVADAPTHPAGYASFIGHAGEARAAGIHIFPLAASGTERYAQYLMRAAEVLTQGRYIFLTDDSGVGDAHATPVVPCFVVTPLAGLMARVVGGELAGARIEPTAADIVRTVGNYSQGRCEEQGQIQLPAGSSTNPQEPAPAEPAPAEPAPAEPVLTPKVPTSSPATGSPPSSAPAEGSYSVETGSSTTTRTLDASGGWTGADGYDTASSSSEVPPTATMGGGFAPSPLEPSAPASMAAMTLLAPLGLLLVALVLAGVAPTLNARRRRERK